MSCWSASTSARKVVILSFPASTLRYLSCRPGMDLRSSLGTDGSFGLDELVAAEPLEPADREVAVLVPAAAAAPQLEPGRDVVHDPAAFGRNRVARHPDALLDAHGLAAVPVLVFQLVRIDLVREIEAWSVAEGREAEVEAPVAVEALPESADELDAEAHHELF